MAITLISIIENLKANVVLLKEKHLSMAARIKALEEENESLRLDLENANRELEKARTDAQFLVVSHRLADSPDTLISTRRQIARLIRNIDKCISMLKEE